MKQLIISVIVGLIIGATAMYFIRSCDTEDVLVPIVIEVPVPGVKDSFPYQVPVLKPYPVENPINKDLKRDLDLAKSQLDSLDIYKKFAVKRSYRSVFKDTIQDITVDMEATGTIDKVKLSYNIKPRKIKVDTVISLPVPKQATIWGTLKTSIPFGESTMKPTVKPGAMFINKKGNLSYTLEGDFVNKGAEIGVGFKF